MVIREVRVVQIARNQPPCRAPGPQKDRDPAPRQCKAEEETEVCRSQKAANSELTAPGSQV